MYRFDDRWVLSNKLTLIEFTTERLSVFNCKAYDADFYNDCLRRLVISDITGLHTSDQDPISESFLIQHGEPLPNVRYLGISIFGAYIERYFRILHERVEFPISSFLGHRTYSLAGLIGEGNGVLDNLFDEAEK